MERNHVLALGGRDLILDALGEPSPAPNSMIGSMATLPLPDHGLGGPLGLFREDRLTHRLYENYKIEVPLSQWPKPGSFNIRISAQLYNSLDDYAALTTALVKELKG
jgi:isopenicillin-N epimerase